MVDYIYELKEAAQLYFVLPLFVFINRNFTYKDIRVFHGRCFTIMYWHGRLVIPALQRFCASQQVAHDEIDPEVLENIAQASGGTFLFSANSTEISNALDTVLVSLLGEYEIRYQPTSIKQYKKETVELTVEELSTEKKFRINNVPSLPFITRMWILGGALFGGIIVGVLPFISWRWYIERQSTPAKE